jgi:tetratricopeptide (TPR) repeat protein
MSSIPAPSPTFIGGQACAVCHVEQAGAWESSHHALAMQRATSSTVLGDFDGTDLAEASADMRFFRRGGEFWINAADAQGNRRDFRVDFTFGIEPLQQYLVALDGGRYQAVTTAWDTRPAENGGQRWFQLMEEDIDHEDPLHWTGVYYNWNSSCAECHSTGLTKNLDFTTGDFATAWTSDHVDCEACHGPGSSHAAAPTTVRLTLPRVERGWVLAEGARIAQRVPARSDDTEIEVCAQCHSRRTQFSDAYEPGDSFLEGFRPALLDSALYHADGQILEEVYEYGSFLQSRMHAAGVACTDCHDPHSGRPRATGNALCTACHLSSAFDTPEHHRHPAGEAGSLCVDCHMSERTYMVVDGRRDHSFRVPRPDLSLLLGVPNACNSCHEDRSVEWGAAQVAAWFPGGRSGTFHYAQALHAGRAWTADRHTLLTRVIGDSGMPPIVRATAITLLAAQMDDSDVELIDKCLRDDSQLVQLAAIEALRSVPVSLRVDLAQRFLGDSPAALRMAAARALLPARDALSAVRRADLDAAIAAYTAAERFNADRAESLLNLGNLEVERGALAAAEVTYRLALEKQPAFAPTYVNLADLYRQQGREREAEALLRRGIQLEPNEPSLKHALGLSLVRSGRLEEALTMLREASEQGAAEPLYPYVYGVALHSSGNASAGLEVLENVSERFPGYAPVLFALATMHRDAGDVETAREYARRLLEVSPGDAAGRALAAELGRG